MRSFPGRLGLQQRVLPVYRLPFLELLASQCQGGLSVFAGSPLPQEGIREGESAAGVVRFKGRNLHFKDPSSPFYLCWQRDILDWLASWNPDALVVEANPRYISTVAAIRWMHRRHKPVLGWGLGAPRTGSLVERYFRQRFLSSLDGIIAYSRRGAAEYRQLGLENVFLACNASASRPAWQFPERSPAPGGPLSVLFVGRLQERKRVDILLQACRRLPEPMQPRLVIVGDGPALTDLKKLAERLYPQAEFTGALYGEELVTHFIQADLFALPGTGGLAIQEAMGYGLPIIVAKGDGTQDDLVRPENGWQVEPGDLEVFYAAFYQALANLPQLRQKGAESYRIAARDVNIEAMADSFIHALSQVTR